MTDSPPDAQFGDEDAVAMLAGASPLQLAREYWGNACAIGGPGNPDMVEAAQLQAQHAAMASTAALLSIAESLHRLAAVAPSDHRDRHDTAKSLDVLAKEITKIRSGRR